MLPDGQRLDDIVGRRFLLAVTPELLAGLPASVRTALEDEPEIAVLSSPRHIRELLDAVESSAVLVRPDRYVLGTARTPAEVEGLLDLLPLGNGRESRREMTRTEETVA